MSDKLAIRSTALTRDRFQQLLNQRSKARDFLCVKSWDQSEKCIIPTNAAIPIVAEIDLTTVLNY
jgi:hypothetical protein